MYLSLCLKSPWGENNCFHSEDAKAWTFFHGRVLVVRRCGVSLPPPRRPRGTLALTNCPTLAYNSTR